MKRKYAAAFILATVIILTYGHALTIDDGSIYVQNGEAAFYSVIGSSDFDPLSFQRIDLHLPHDVFGGHYSLTALSLENEYWAVRSFALELPGYDDPLETESVSLPLLAAELRIPFHGGRIGLGHFTTEISDLPGKVDGIGVRLRLVDVSGYYVNAVFGDIALFGFGGAVTGTVAISNLKAGGFEGSFGAVGASWKRYGIAAGYFRGECSLSDNIAFNLLTGKSFGVDGGGAIGAFGAWGYAEIIRGSYSFSLRSFLGLAWSTAAAIEYREGPWPASASEEYFWIGALGWKPSGIAVFWPNIDIRVNPSLAVSLGRVIPIIWGWDYSEDTGEAHQDYGEGNDWGSVRGISLESLLLSGLSISCTLTFK